MGLFTYAERTEGSGDEPSESWRKSSRSYSSGGCVEVGTLSRGLIGVRDSKRQRGIVLRFNPAEWDTFVDGIRAGTFDPL
jgi:hypothetical protein